VSRLAALTALVLLSFGAGCHSITRARDRAAIIEAVKQAEAAFWPDRRVEAQRATIDPPRTPLCGAPRSAAPPGPYREAVGDLCDQVEARGWVVADRSWLRRSERSDGNPVRIALSPVGFSTDGKAAVVYVEWHDRRSGAGAYLLSMHGGRWGIDRRVSLP
jgi:hypothetical protein